MHTLTRLTGIPRYSKSLSPSVKIVWKFGSTWVNRDEACSVTNTCIQTSAMTGTFAVGRSPAHAVFMAAYCHTRPRHNSCCFLN